MKIAIILLLCAGVCLGDPVESSRLTGMRSMKQPSRSEAANKTKVLPDTKVIKTQQDRANRELTENKSKTDALDIIALKMKEGMTGGMRTMRGVREAGSTRKMPVSPGNVTSRPAPKPQRSQPLVNKTISKRDTMRMGMQGMGMQGMGMQGMGMMRMGGRMMMKREAENLKLSNDSQVFTKGGLKGAHNVTKRDTMRMGMQGMGMQGMGMMRMGSRMMKRETGNKKTSNDSQISVKRETSSLKTSQNTTITKKAPKIPKAAHKVTKRDTMRMGMQGMGMQGMGMMRMGSRMMKREAENLKPSNDSQVFLKGDLKDAHNMTKRDTMRMGMQGMPMQGMGMMRMGSRMMKRETGDKKASNDSQVIMKGGLKGAHSVTTRDTMGMGMQGMRMQGMGMMRMGSRIMKREAEKPKLQVSPNPNAKQESKEIQKIITRPKRHHSAMHVETPKRNPIASTNKPGMDDEETLLKPKRDLQSANPTVTPGVIKRKGTNSSALATRPKRSSGSGGGYGGGAPAPSSGYSAPARSSSYSAPARSSTYSAPARSSTYSAPARASSYGGGGSRSSGYGR